MLHVESNTVLDRMMNLTRATIEWLIDHGNRSQVKSKSYLEDVEMSMEQCYQFRSLVF